MPPVTTDDAFSGVVGFMVVLARRKAQTPRSATITPNEAHTLAIIKRHWPEERRTAGSRCAAAHIAAPTIRATAGGGTFSSSACMSSRSYQELITRWVTESCRT